jgi:hypothetical protein
MRKLMRLIARVLACVMGWFRTTNAEIPTREDVSPHAPLVRGDSACLFCGEEMSEEDKREMGYDPDERELHEVPEEELLERIPMRDPLERELYYPLCQGCLQKMIDKSEYEYYWESVEDDGH